MVPHSVLPHAHVAPVKTNAGAAVSIEFNHELTAPQRRFSSLFCLLWIVVEFSCSPNDIGSNAAVLSPVNTREVDGGGLLLCLCLGGSVVVTGWPAKFSERRRFG